LIRYAAWGDLVSGERKQICVLSADLQTRNPANADLYLELWTAISNRNLCDLRTDNGDM